MKSVAVTDHGNMFGAIDFYTEGQGRTASSRSSAARPTSRRPIAPTAPNRRNYHLILLAKNDGRLQEPLVPQLDGRTSRASTTTRASTRSCCASTPRGSIGLSACLGGEVAQTLDAAAASTRPRRSRASTRASSRRATSSSSCSQRPRPSRRQVNGELERDVARRPASRSSPPTTATTSTARTPRAHEILMCIQTGKTPQGREAAASTDVDSYYMKSPAEMDDARSSDMPEAIENTARDRERVQRRAQARQDASCRTFKVPDGYDARHATSPSSPTKGLERRFARAAPRAASKFDPDQYRARCEHRARRHPEDGLLGLLPHRLGLHQLGQGARHPGRAGPRLGRRLAGRLRAAHHRHRSDRRTSCCSSAS